MKKFLLGLLCFSFLLPFATIAKDKKKKEKETTKEVAADSVIHWMTLDEVQVAMKEKPKRVFMDVYTDWCGWCKVMEKKTFSNKDVAKYMNDNFYAVRVNAEQKDTILFMGRKFGFIPQSRANQFALELLGGRMSYPTSVILEENFQNPIPISGYQNVATMEKVLKYIATDTYKTVQFPEYEKTFVATWKEDPNAGPATPGH